MTIAICLGLAPGALGFGALGFGAQGAGAIPVASCPAGTPKTVVVLLRHAERDGELINEAGWQRARTLAKLVLGQFGHLDAVVHTTYERTAQTLQPALEAAREKGQSVAVAEFEPDDAAGLEKFVREQHARKGPETIILVAGHTNTIRPALERLDQSETAAHTAEWFPCKSDICHQDYDDLWTVTLCGGAAPSLRKANYGSPTP